MKHLSGFERNIKESLHGYEAPYDPKSWTDLERQLDSKASGSQATWIAAAAAVGIATVGSVFYFMNKDQGIAASSLQSDALIWRDTANVRTAHIEEKIADVEISAEEFVAVEKPSPQPSTAKVSKPAQTTTASTDAGNTADAGNNKSHNTTSNNHAEDNATLITSRSSMAAFSVSAVEACVGEEVEFNLINSSVQGNFLWNFGDGDFDIRETPSHAFDKAGIYHVSLSITEGESGNIHNSPVGQPIVVREKPKADFSTKSITASVKSSVVQLQNESYKADECTWEVNGVTSHEINPEFSLPGKGKYIVKLFVENENGCSDSFVDFIEIKDDVKLGAAPTLSLSEGEAFMPTALTDPDLQFRMTIYDQKTPIFETFSAHLGWDGTLENGEQAVINKKYTWVVTLLDNGNERGAFSGSVKILP